jgi:hypothetical protein
MNTKQEYEQLLWEIGRLHAKKEELEAKMIEKSDNFADKFRIWYNNDDVCHDEWMLDEEEYPILRKLFDKNVNEKRRGKTYELYDLLENGVVIASDFLTTNNRTTVKIPFQEKTRGTYTYAVRLTNKTGQITNSNLTVNSGYFKPL